MTPLTAREARVLKALAECEGGVLSIYELAVAAGQPEGAFEEFSGNHSVPKACDRTYNYVYSLARKFPGSIEGIRGRGFRMVPGALRGGGA